MSRPGTPQSQSPDPLEHPSITATMIAVIMIGIVTIHSATTTMTCTKTSVLANNIMLSMIASLNFEAALNPKAPKSVWAQGGVFQNYPYSTLRSLRVTLA